MSIASFLVLLLIAALCGSLGQALAGYTIGGLFLSIAVGLVGAVLGMWLAGQLGLPELFMVEVGGENFPIVWSIVGSALFALGIGVLRKRK